MTADARRVIADARGLRERAEAARALAAERRQAARDRYDRVRWETVTAQLRRMPVERLRETSEGRLRIGPLRAGGITSVGHLLGAGVAYLTRIPGVGEQTARRAVGAARQLETGLRESVRIRIDADQRPSEHTDLLAALAAVHQVDSLLNDEADGLSALVDGLAESLPQAAPARSRLRMFFTGAERRRRVDAAVAHLADTLRWAQDRGLVTALDRLAEPPLAGDELWRDYERRAALYNGLLIEISGQAPDEDSAQGFLPKEIAERVASHPLDTRLLAVSLRGYQAFGARFVLAQRRAILGDEMGLGKTIEALAVMCHLSAADAATHFLVVCPASVLVNWTHEVERHSDLRPLRLHGEDRRRNLREWERHGGVAVTTFESLKALERPPGAPLDLLVVDEAHYVKNPGAQRTRAVTRWIADVERVLFLSGTPMENRVDEFKVLVGHLSSDIADGVHRADGALGSQGFRAAVAPVYLRRNQEDVLTELPPRIETEDWVTLGPEDGAAYRAAVASGNFMAMRRAAYLSQASAKLERLAEIVDEAMADGRKVVVFSFFRDVLAQVRRTLGAAVSGEISGAVPPAGRQLVIDEFGADPRPSVLLSQIEAGGVGLNIQAASIVVLCEPQWKPSTENQAIARAHRMGQARTVTVHRILAEDTVDEHMRTVLRSKGLLFDEYVRRSDVKDSAPEAVDVSSLAEVEKTVSRAEDERRIIEMERRRLGITDAEVDSGTTTPDGSQPA